jgi:hypothetical protein
MQNEIITLVDTFDDSISTNLSLTDYTRLLMKVKSAKATLKEWTKKVEEKEKEIENILQTNHPPKKDEYGNLLSCLIQDDQTGESSVVFEFKQNKRRIANIDKMKSILRESGCAGIADHTFDEVFFDCKIKGVTEIEKILARAGVPAAKIPEAFDVHHGNTIISLTKKSA